MITIKGIKKETVETPVSIELELPYFCRDGHRFYAAIEDANKLIKVIEIKAVALWNSCSIWNLGTMESELINATPISEDEFLIVYDAFVQKSETLLCTLRTESV